MIRLFRKIRHQLLSEDKYSTYALYATGEMLLVVVGILLALQIDNWNSVKSEKEILARHLITALENLEDDRSQLSELTQFRQESALLSTKIIDGYKQGLIIDSKEFMDAFLSIE